MFDHDLKETVLWHIGTIELFHRDSKDYFNRCGLLRLDLKSDYDLFDCDMVATKIPTFAGERNTSKCFASSLPDVRS